MFNSPINRLFGISNVNKDGKQQNASSHKEQKQGENEKENNNQLFNDNQKLYEDISLESFDVENFIKKYFSSIKNKIENPKIIKKINDFLANFDKTKFENKYGKNLSKEDLSIILYDLADKWGIKQ